MIKSRDLKVAQREWNELFKCELKYKTAYSDI